MGNRNVLIKVKLYPTIKQKQMLENHFNAFRFCYNLCIDYKSQMWKFYSINKSGYDMQKELFEIRNETVWLKKCKAECLKEAALEVKKSFEGFYSKGKGYPKFKTRKGIQSFHAYQNIKCKNNKVAFFKYAIKFKDSLAFSNILQNNKIKKVTFKKDHCSEYFATFLIELPQLPILKETTKIIGIDLGIKDLAITSEGVKYPNNKYLIQQDFKLKKLNRKYSKAKKGGHNKEKIRIKIAKIHRKCNRQKAHIYHQITNSLISENQTIILETLSVKNMILNHKLARNISDVSWGMFVAFLEYKAKWHNRKIIKIDRFYPSSKTCSKCGNIKDNLTLSERIYKCDYCGLSIDRDINAAINIRNSGLKISGVPLEGVGYEPSELGSNN